MSRRPQPAAVPPPSPEWLRPARLVPDLLCGVWILLVATSYLGLQLVGALELLARRLGG